MDVSYGIPDVGGWFRTAVDRPRVRRIEAWQPNPGLYGLISDDATVRQAADVLSSGRAAVLTGAGMSTASGLPDYRGRDAVPRSPMTYQEFTGSDLSRRRYWARSTVGWEAFTRAEPNRAHHLLVDLAGARPLTGIITQNVDGLHQKAGSRPVLDLHGQLETVLCLDCGDAVDRVELQAELLRLNPGFALRLPELARQAMTAPDGDAEVDRTAEFVYPDCPCGGILKPDVVFFGENAKPAVVHAAFDMVTAADALLVLGTSLSVMSGLRFVRRAVREGKPVVIMGDGPTRGDELATVRVHGRLDDLLQRLLVMLR